MSDLLQLQETECTATKPSPFPEYPWQKVATDLFEWKKTTYILIIDYYSHYIEISSLRASTSTGVIQKIKTIFAQHGIPECIASDNGPCTVLLLGISAIFR